MLVNSSETKVQCNCYELGLWEDPGRIIFNADETGLQLIFQPGKALSKKGNKYVYGAMVVEKGSTVTVIVCISAIGQAAPRLVIMKALRQRDAYSRGIPNGSVVHMSDCRYMASEVYPAFVCSRYKPQRNVCQYQTDKNRLT
jgi:hypothetical protein